MRTLLGLCLLWPLALWPKSLLIQIQGIPPVLLTAIQEQIQLHHELDETLLSEYTITPLLRRIETDLKRALQPYGYYHTTIRTEAHIRPHNSEATLHLDLGPPTRLTQAHMQLSGSGKHDPALRNLFTPFEPHLAETFDQDLYEASKARTLNTVLQAGYPYARYRTHQVEIDTTAASAALDLDLDTGPFLSVGALTFDDANFDAALLHRYVAIAPNTPYQVQVLAQIQDALSSSNYFQNVEVTPHLDKTRADVPIDVHLVRREPNQFLGGIGYGTDTGARLRLEWNRRYLNRYGHHLHNLLYLSAKQQWAEFEYRIPGEHPRTEFFEFGFRTEHTQIQSADTMREWTAAKIHQTPNYQRRLSTGFLQEFSENPMGATPTRARLMRVGVAVQRMERDALFNPDSGYRLSAEGNVFWDLETPDHPFLQTRLAYKTLRTLSPRTHLLFRAEWGGTFGASPTQLPHSLQFFAGGDQSVRGFAYESLIPPTPTSNIPDPATQPVRGGLFLTTASLEWIQTLRGPWGFSVFTDTGSAYHTWPARFAVSVGCGIRYQTPIGPIRIEIAKPLYTPQGPLDAFRIHLAFGPEV